MEKKKRKGIQLAYPFEERRLTNPKFGWAQYFPVIVQPKLDGERCRAICRGSQEPILLSSTESIITSVPHISHAIRDRCFHGELDGELYVKGMDFDDIHSIVSRSVNLHSDYEQMEYHIFDIINSKPQAERLVSLENNTNLNRPPLRLVEFDIAHTFQDIMYCYEKYTQLDYEGIIVRHKIAPYERKRSRFMLKFKPKKSDVYKIIGYSQMKDKDGNLKPTLGSLMLTSDEGTTFSVGSGMTESFRELTWVFKDELFGKYCKINYQHMTPNHVPRFPVFVGISDENPEESVEDIGGVL